MSGTRALASAVLMRAIRDLYGAVPASATASARRFLRPTSPTLQFYCDGLDLEPEALLSAIRKNGPAWARSGRPVRVLEEAS